MFLNIVITIISLFVVIKGADIFVVQSVSLAKKLKLSEFIIGFAIVSLGTSIPELSTSIYSTFTGHQGLAISNIIGSNITNITLILGLLAFFNSYKISSADVKYNIPLLILSSITVFIALFLTNFQLSPVLGIFLILGFFTVLYITNKENHRKNIQTTEKFNLLKFLFSILLILIFSKFCIDNIVSIAITLNISETIFGYLLVALGTSLPELATTLQAVKNGKGELGLGNLLGSNMFNLLFILGTMPLIRNIDISSFKVEFALMIFVTFFLIIFAHMGKKYFFSKKEGLFMVFLYIVYITVVLVQNRLV